MRTPGDKKATTIRLAPDIKSRLENVARLTRSSESSIVEAALTEYFKNHGYNTRYVMKANQNHYGLLKFQDGSVDVLDWQVRNGVPLERLRESYAASVNAPVEFDEGVSND